MTSRGQLEQKLLEQIWSNTNPQWNPNGSWNYVKNHYFGVVLQYMRDNNKKSIVDLGAGVGDCLFKALKKGYDVHGYEYDRELIEQHIVKCGDVNADAFVSYKDLEDLKGDELRGFDVIYSYAPFHDPLKREKLVNIVLNSLTKDQVFVWRHDFCRNIDWLTKILDDKYNHDLKMETSFITLK